MRNTMNKDEAKQLAEKALTELHQALQAGKSETLKRYLAAMGRFHHYSFSNSMLIAIQNPNATHVAGFRRWLQLGRHVRKGEKGIGILAPLVYRKRDEDSAPDENKGSSIHGFKVVHVFDISQTDGEELPEFAAISGDPGELLPALEQMVRESGIELQYEELPNGTFGVSRQGRIAITTGLSPAETFSVLVHETAHEWMHNGEQRKALDKTVRETEAEAVAFVVCQAFGLDCSTQSSDYIQLYRGSATTLSESLDRIQKTATRIIETLSQSTTEHHEEVSQVA